MKKQNLNAVSLSPEYRWSTQWSKPKAKGETNKMPSMTVPDQSMTLVELIDRFASGDEMSLGQRMYYDGIGHDVTVEDDLLLGRHWDSFDLSEKHDILKNAKHDFEKINKGVKLAQKERAEKLEAERKEKQKREDELLEAYKNMKKA